ncbi:MAG: S8 family serine peptidase [Rhodospirillaceae bacterium]|nr:S8 family serine peptidase [Rhodospirillaceae bacterium]MBT7768890.1 S8 family serine peptidase [Rhodospirillales bacterium]MBT4700390.1 S8 family serine peptidase [Rhodospirillaceae bacterium]MBT5036307.1 S8 family serine peptidase [Rhodospirillaceae bacterium]MBT6219597.1 S8 family serine peptidase [Rhodospirillaceae bacterium]
MRIFARISRPVAFCIALSGLYLTGCAQTPDDGANTKLPPVHELARHEDDNVHHEGEFLVLDPPPDYESSLSELGLSIIDITHLDGMGSKLYHMKIDSGAHPFHARHLHEQRHPEVISDVHHHFEQHAAAKNRSHYVSRRAAKWGKAKSSCGRGIRMGMVDGGVDTKHSAFKASKLAFRSFHRKGQKMSSISHGTAVASMLVGSKKYGSLLPGAHLSAANVFHRTKKGRSRASAKSILKAINWLIKQKVQVINFSIGGPSNRLVRKAVEHADKLGIIMVASAGNNGPFTRKKSYPAAYPPVIAIAASDEYDTVARFSSAGKYVEFTAPGVKIWTAIPGGSKAMSGTSFSSPLVAGFTAAAIKYKKITKRDAVRAYFKKIAKAKGKKEWDQYSGWGFVSVASPC